MNNNHPIPMKGGAEYDAFSNWRGVRNFQAHERAKAKAQYWRRFRRQYREMLRKELDQHLAERDD